MSAIDNNRNSLAGLTLDAVLRTEKRSPTQMNKTLLDIIRDEEPHGSLFGHKDKKSWKAFRDRLRLKRAGAAWTSSIPVPTSDVPIPITNNNRLNNAYPSSNSRSFMARRNSVRFTTPSSVGSDETSENSSTRGHMVRRASTRVGFAPSESDESSADISAVEDAPPVRSFRPQMSRHNSTRIPADQSDNDPDGSRLLSAALTEDRIMSAREAVVAQEASEAAAQAEAAAAAAAEAAAAAAAERGDEDEDGGEGNEEAQPVRMSLMDLLEETDRQMGVVGSRYTMGDDDDDDYEEGEEADDDGEEDGGGGGGVEVTCCVCMVRHKGSAFIPCGHTFCRLCSRELWVQRGNCPLCNGYILEILDIF